MDTANQTYYPLIPHLAVLMDTSHPPAAEDGLKKRATPFLEKLKAVSVLIRVSGFA